jgi:hypothetical protein
VAVVLGGLDRKDEAARELRQMSSTCPHCGAAMSQAALLRELRQMEAALKEAKEEYSKAIQPVRHLANPTEAMRRRARLAQNALGTLDNAVDILRRRRLKEVV